MSLQTQAKTLARSRKLQASSPSITTAQVEPSIPYLKIIARIIPIGLCGFQCCTAYKK